MDRWMMKYVAKKKKRVIHVLSILMVEVEKAILGN